MERTDQWAATQNYESLYVLPTALPEWDVFWDNCKRVFNDLVLAICRIWDGYFGDGVSLDETSFDTSSSASLQTSNPSILNPPQRPLTKAPSLKIRREVIKTVYKDVYQNTQLTWDEQSATLVQIVKEVNQFTEKTKTHEGHRIDLHGQTYMVTHHLPETIHKSKIPAVWKKIEELQKGSFGIVSKGEYIGATGAGRRDIMKESLKNDGKSKRNVEKEFNVYQDIHRYGYIKGVAPSPHTIAFGQFVSFLAPEQRMDGYFVGRAKKSNNKETKLNPEEEQLLTDSASIHAIVQSVIVALKSLHARGYYHGDGKSENFLWSGRELLIADFGGARKFEELVSLHKFPSLSKILGVSTLGSICEKTFKNIESIYIRCEKKYDKEIDPLRQEQVIKEMLIDIKPLLIKSDYFAWGTGIYMSFTGLIPSFLDEIDPKSNPPILFPQVYKEDIDQMEHDLLNAGFTEETWYCVKSMITAPYTKF